MGLENVPKLANYGVKEDYFFKACTTKFVNTDNKTVDLLSSLIIKISSPRLFRKRYTNRAIF